MVAMIVNANYSSKESFYCLKFLFFQYIIMWRSSPKVACWTSDHPGHWFEPTQWPVSRLISPHCPLGLCTTQAKKQHIFIF